MRTAFRSAMSELLALGIPPAKLGLMLGFQSERGFGGREGTAPASAWFEVVKLETLAARTVAGETGISTVWAWGWGTFGASGNDPDKWVAACSWLWTRDHALCDAPAAAGADFDTDLSAGQIVLPVGQQCSIGGDAITTAEIDALARLTGDRDVAFTALLQRLVQRSATAAIPDSVVADAEKAIILTRFRGVRTLYEQALARAGIGDAVARAIIADALRAGSIETTLPPKEPLAATILEFYDVAFR